MQPDTAGDFSRRFVFFADFPPDPIMPSRRQIADAIAAVARRLHRTPTREEFGKRSGISAYFVLQRFDNWNEAVKAAGLRPHTSNARKEEHALLEDWGESVRKHGKVPARHIYLREGNFSPGTLAKRFGGWTKVGEAFRRFAEGKREWTDVVALLPVLRASACALKKKSEENQARLACANAARGKEAAGSRQRTIYGNPLNFCRMRHEPVNEQGVVLLFGILAEKLGYAVEAVQNGFPDCEAKRQIAPGRWQRVRIEFEFESRNFLAHRHPPDGCDLIVCWRHNWRDCPSHLEVLELSSLIKSLETSR